MTIRPSKQIVKLQKHLHVTTQTRLSLLSLGLSAFRCKETAIHLLSVEVFTVSLLLHNTRISKVSLRARHDVHIVVIGEVIVGSILAFRAATVARRFSWAFGVVGLSTIDDPVAYTDDILAYVHPGVSFRPYLSVDGDKPSTDEVLACFTRSDSELLEGSYQLVCPVDGLLRLRLLTFEPGPLLLGAFFFVRGCLLLLLFRRPSDLSGIPSSTISRPSLSIPNSLISTFSKSRNSSSSSAATSCQSFSKSRNLLPVL
mmetsp:Transcript_4944/g.14872  ORF Transcript_4944/g.14872 Transcript_4944/m.14872 type:complete len:257 (-) Transcript_4944:294-1064(-)